MYTVTWKMLLLAVYFFFFFFLRPLIDIRLAGALVSVCFGLVLWSPWFFFPFTIRVSIVSQ